MSASQVNDIMGMLCAAYEEWKLKNDILDDYKDSIWSGDDEKEQVRYTMWRK